MRRLFIIALVFLLPLRAWAGDLMGVQMVMGIAAPLAANAMPPGCTMHAQADAGQADAGAPQTPNGRDGKDGMNSCSACDLCIPMAELASATHAAVSAAAHAKPLMAGADFVSASPALALEPPIS